MKRIFSALALLCLMLLPTAVHASTFEFEGFTWMDRGAYVRTWAGAASDYTSSSISDPASTAWAAFWDFTVAGLAGPAYEAGHNYSVNKTVNGLEIWSSQPSDLYYVGGVKTVFSSSLNITSITLDQSATTLILTGRLANISVDQTFGSAIFNDLARTGASFSLIVSTPKSMLAQLNNTSRTRLDASYTAGLTNDLRASMVAVAATPEPGTLILMGSAVAGMGWWNRRTRRQALKKNPTCAGA